MYKTFKWIGLIVFVIYFLTFLGPSHLPIFVISIFFGATIIHEISHCCVARLWTSDCTIKWRLSLEPGTAIFHSPHEIPTPYFKFVGAAPLGAGLTGLLMSAIFIFFGWPTASVPLIVIIGMSGGLLASISESDEFAIRHPAAFQEYASDHDQWHSALAREYV